MRNDYEAELNASSIPVWVTAATANLKEKCSHAFGYAAQVARYVQQSIIGNNRKVLRDEWGDHCAFRVLWSQRLRDSLNEFTARTQPEPEPAAA